MLKDVVKEIPLMNEWSLNKLKERCIRSVNISTSVPHHPPGSSIASSWLKQTTRKLSTVLSQEAQGSNLFPIREIKEESLIESCGRFSLVNN